MPLNIKKVVRKVKINEQPSDFAYWQTQTPQQRLAALKQIRREYHGWPDDYEPRIERVVRKIRRSS